jgi:Holliday junction DNA helicase RuvA
VIAWLEGALRDKTPTRIVLDVHGVGYELFVPLSTSEALPEIGKTVSLLVHTAVREDAIQLSAS